MSMKTAYDEKFAAKIAEWDAEIAKLKAKADQAEAGARIQYHKEIEHLREQQQKAQAQLQKLRESSEDAWEDLKAGIEAAWTQLEDALNKAKGRFDGQ